MDTRWKSTLRRIRVWFPGVRGFFGLLLLLCSAMGMLLLSLVWAHSLYIVYLLSFFFVGATSVLCLYLLLPPNLTRIGFPNTAAAHDLAAWHADVDLWRGYLKRGALVYLVFLCLVVFLRTGFANGYREGDSLLLVLFLLALLGVLTLVAYAIFRPYARQQLNEVWEAREAESREHIRAAEERGRRSMEQAARSERLKVELITNVSHDLKTPLTSMVGYIELLKKQDLDTESAGYVEIIDRRAEKLKEMIESLFDLAKVSSGNVQLSPVPLDLNRLVEQVLSDMEDRLAGSGLSAIRLLTTADTGLVSDPAYLYRIVQNLLENALKYSAKGTRIFFKSYLTADMVHLDIINTAGYLMDFKKEDILERFARGDKTRGSEGNGLGLAIVSTYANALGGTFDIQIDCDQFKACLAFPKAPEGTTGAEAGAEAEAHPEPEPEADAAHPGKVEVCETKAEARGENADTHEENAEAREKANDSGMDEAREESAGTPAGTTEVHAEKDESRGGRAGVRVRKVAGAEVKLPDARLVDARMETAAAPSI